MEIKIAFVVVFGHLGQRNLICQLFLPKLIHTLVASYWHWGWCYSNNLAGHLLNNPIPTPPPLTYIIWHLIKQANIFNLHELWLLFLFFGITSSTLVSIGACIIIYLFRRYLLRSKYAELTCWLVNKFLLKTTLAMELRINHKTLSALRSSFAQCAHKLVLVQVHS